MDNTIAKILEETGSKNVKDVIFNPAKNKWVIIYNDVLYSREFDFFDEVYEFLSTNEQNR